MVLGVTSFFFFLFLSFFFSFSKLVKGRDRFNSFLEQKYICVSQKKS